MRELLELCVEIDSLAARAYDSMSVACSDEDLSKVMAHMATEERIHVKWWKDLISAWDQGLIPDLVNDTENLNFQMASVLSDMRAALPENVSRMTDDDILQCAAKIEFYMLDPVFAEMLDLTEPGSAAEHREEYDRHVQHIVGAIERHYGESTLAGFLARVLRRSWRDNVTIARFASRDGLTGMYNRQGMLLHLRQWAAWAARYERPLSVLLIDVDDFRRVNDRYGHAIGDVALKSLADSLDDVVRASDTVARYGGDEFGVVAPETDATEAAQLAERVIDAVRDTILGDWDGSRIPLTATIGIATVSPPFAPAERIAAELLAVADRSLYVAKNAGKDRVGESLVLLPTTVLG